MSKPRIMDENEIFILPLLVITLIACLCYMNYIINEKTKCIKGKDHDWKFWINSKGSTGDLGFGIKGSWNKNYYKCANCGKEKEEEIY